MLLGFPCTSASSTQFFYLNNINILWNDRFHTNAISIPISRKCMLYEKWYCLKFKRILKNTCRNAISSQSSLHNGNTVDDGLLLACNDEETHWWDDKCLFHPIVIKDPNSEAFPWLLYYYGRDENTWKDGLAPALLTTGYIGMAISSDGFNWKRHRGPLKGGALFGSSSDPSAFDYLHVACSDVHVINDEWWMYYFGGSLEEVAMAAGKTSKGLRMRPGLARSMDGFEFHREQNSLLDVGKEGEWDEMFVAWPRVIPPWIRFDKSTGNEMIDPIPSSSSSSLSLSSFPTTPTPTPTPSSSSSSSTSTSPPLWLMTYSSIEKTNPPKSSIGLAISFDGLEWEKKGKILECGAEGSWDENGVGRRHVIRVVDEFLMFYEGVDRKGSHSIGLATSMDGKVWKKDDSCGSEPGGPVFTPRFGEEAWDCKVVAAPHVVPLGDGTFRLYYVGQDEKKTSYGIGVALSVGNNFRSWRRYSRK